MPDIFTCPVAAVTPLYQPELAAVLRQHLPPIEAARPGDLVGLSMGCSDSAGGPFPSGVDLFIVKSGDDDFEALPYGDLPDELQPKAAHLALLLQHDRTPDSAAIHVFCALRPVEEDEYAYYRLVCLPDAIGVINCDVSAEYCGPKPWSQDRIETFTWLLLPMADSAHQRLARLEQGARLMPDWTRIVDLFNYGSTAVGLSVPSPDEMKSYEEWLLED